LSLALLAGAGCAVSPDRTSELDAAVADLAAGGYGFDPDVAFAEDDYVVCHSVSCSELRVVNGRRTVLLARDAFASPSRLRATLLDMQGRYQTPRPPARADQMRSALRILEGGPDVGVTDPGFLRRVHQSYRQLYDALEPAERKGLLAPDDVPYP
jgi:hypothetical protein